MKKRYIHTISCTKILLKRTPPIIKLKSEYVHTAKTAVNLFNKAFDMKDLSDEILAAIYLSHTCKINGLSIIAQGSGNTTYVNIREVFKNALLHNASQFIIAHNHPGGNPSPSPEDFDLTNRILDAAEIMNINLTDHIIIADDHYSFKDNGHLEGSDSI